jgi:hypothetical protein
MGEPSGEQPERDGVPAEPDGEPHDEDGEYNAAYAVTDVLTNKEFLEFARETVDKIVEARKDTIKHGENWLRINRLFLWQRFALSVVAISIIGYLGFMGILSKDVVGTLMAGVVASLFVTPKKDWVIVTRGFSRFRLALPVGVFGVSPIGRSPLSKLPTERPPQQRRGQSSNSPKLVLPSRLDHEGAGAPTM